MNDLIQRKEERALRLRSATFLTSTKMSFHSAGLARALDDMHDFHRQREIAAPILPGRREGERDYILHN